MQNLRSKEDYFYKHSLNVAILCAMIAHTMNVSVSEQLDVVTAAIVHDIGKLSAPKNLLLQDTWTEAERDQMRNAEVAGFSKIEHVFSANPSIKRICMQAQNNLDNLQRGRATDMSRMVTGAKILSVAETFDTMTAVQLDRERRSEIAAFKHLLQNPRYFDEKVVSALSDSINILVPGVSVELNTGAKGLVLVENERNILKPLILTFNDNRIIDLGNRIYDGHIEIVDIMKTMDNRHVMNRELLKRHGIDVEEPEYVNDDADDEAEEEYIPGMM